MPQGSKPSNTNKQRPRFLLSYCVGRAAIVFCELHALGPLLSTVAILAQGTTLGWCDSQAFFVGGSNPPAVIFF